MHVIQPKIEVPDDIFERFKENKVTIMGLAKDVDNGRVVKHLDLSSESEPRDNSNSSAEAANESADSNADGLALIVVLCVVATAAIVGGGIWIAQKLNQRKLNRFKMCLRDYVDAVNEQRLTIDHIEKLSKSMDAIKKKQKTKMKVEFSGDEIIALVECLCRHTQNMAEVNEYDIELLYTEEEQNDEFLRLRRNLDYQKEILKMAG